jgi:hypothetical protein
VCVLLIFPAMFRISRYVYPCLLFLLTVVDEYKMVSFYVALQASPCIVVVSYWRFLLGVILC